MSGAIFNFLTGSRPNSTSAPGVASDGSVSMPGAAHIINTEEGSQTEVAPDTTVEASSSSAVAHEETASHPGPSGHYTTPSTVGVKRLPDAHELENTKSLRVRDTVCTFVPHHVSSLTSSEGERKTSCREGNADLRGMTKKLFTH